MNDSLDKSKLPRHVAIIMDGNGRWAKERGLSRIEGHKQGAETVERITEHAREIGVKYLTLYAFSKENWQRPSEEVQGLMKLLMEFLYTKKDKMIRNQISLNAIGELSALNSDVRELLEKTISETQGGQEMVLTLCLSYGSRDEILRAIQRLHDKNFDSKYITENEFAECLDTYGLPDPDLVIRTSGEKRISNFLLWQSAYAEYAFVSSYWPDFSSQDLDNCLRDYQSRERRFGLTSEQIK